MVPTPSISKELLSETARLFYEYNKSVKKAAGAAGVPYTTFTSRVRRCRELGYINDQAEIEFQNQPEAKPKDEVKVVLKLEAEPLDFGLDRPPLGLGEF